ncbi:MAG: TolC family outer membrane protein [Acidobacteriia bacterium]|nr:TolC family outer membrane protein [Methyloceanibacter sp.]MCL6490306.1 TolC family outer membrane protein [Terriglobia bacterium]
MQKWSALFIGGLLAWSAGSALAQQATPQAPQKITAQVTQSTKPRAGQQVTLQHALAAAYSNNPVLLQERAHLRSIDENVPTALAGWHPTIIGNGQAGFAAGTFFFFAPPVIAAQRGFNLGQLTITQPIYTGGKVHAQVAQAKNQVMAERARLIATEQQVFQQAVSAYVGVIAAQQILQLNINNELVLTKQLEATTDRFRVGELTRTDVAQAEAALAAARSQRETAEGSLETARATYRQVIGEEPANLIEPQPLKLPVKTNDAANRLAAANNPNVVAALFDHATAKDALDAAYAALMPTVNVQAQGFSINNQSFPKSYSRGGTLTANLNLPIYQGGSEYAAIRAARQSEQAARKALDNARRVAVQQATAAWQTLMAARAAVESDRASVRANEIALEGIQREALVGSRTILDVLITTQQLLTSEVTLVQDLATLVNNSYNLAAAVGRLTARDLALPVPLYDETAYYNAVRSRWFGTGDYATDQPGR